MKGHKKLTDDLATLITNFTQSPEAREIIEATEKAADDAAGTFEVVITTENLDRYDEVIKLDGWELEHYRNNPVVLWGHDHKQLPVGIATDISVVDGKMIAKGKFALHEFAQTVRQLYDAGVLRATSVGFIEREREGNLITKAELIEFSFVSVPANPYALSTLVKSSFNVNDMVTKGLVFVEKDGSDDSEEKEEQEEQTENGSVEPSNEEEKPENGSEKPEDEPESEEQPTDEAAEEGAPEKSIEVQVAELNNKVDLILKALGASALEDTDGEPEGTEPEDEAAEQMKEFSAKRRTIQEAATILSDVLAEARQAIEAKKSQ